MRSSVSTLDLVVREDPFLEKQLLILEFNRITRSGMW